MEFSGRNLPAAALVCGGIMGLSLALVSWLYLAGETAPFAFAVLYLAVGTGIVLAVITLCRVIPAKNGLRFCICLAAAVFAVRGVFVLLVPTEPVSDFLALYHAAQQLAQGNNVMNDKLYFRRWAYQSGFVAWMALWIRLFGADVFFFQMTNCVFGAGTAVLVYGLSRRFASPQGARAAGILYLLYPGSVLLAPVLTNQHLSELLLLAALYVATGGEGDIKGRLLRGGAAGLLLAFSNVIRPAAIVAVIAVLAVLLLELFCWKELGRDGLLPIAGGALAVAAVYVLATRGASWLIRVTGLNQNGLTNQVPMWKFVLGLNTASKGGWNAADDAIVFAADQLAENQAAAQQLLKERLAELTPGRLLTLFWEKIKGMWGNFEATHWTFTANVTEAYTARGQVGNLNWVLSKAVRIASGFAIANSLLTAAGCVRAALKKEKGREAALLLTLTALAYFSAHLFIEIQRRYRTTLFVVAFPLAALGADWFGSLAGRLLGRWKEKRKET